MDADGFVVKFVPFASTVESSFWVRYCQEKLDRIQLSEAPIDLIATYSVDGPRLQVQETSLDISTKIPNDRIAVKGSLLGFNTLESFQQVDKNEFLRTFMQNLEGKMTSFVLLTYADLKNHKVLYWFAMPALMPRASIRAVRQEFLRDVWTLEQRQTLCAHINELRGETCPPFFIYNEEKCLPLSSYDGNEHAIFGFFDPADGAPMGWPMRNLIAHLSLTLKLGGKTVRVLSYRPKLLRRTSLEDSSFEEVNVSFDEQEDSSVLLHVVVPEDYDDQKVVGWELNARSKPGPRWVNLRPLLDSQHLAIQAADLNLKLMKWRMIPSLDVEKLQSTRVLIIGAGTLGCSVARVLLGWGIRHIKFVDYGKVSYSNPCRQSLFTLEDCNEGGRSKATAAAEALRSIAADVQSEGHVFSIPMPGHKEESVELSVNTLDAMVQECDVVFLLTDTRESRWLPTVMAAAHDKMLLNAALGLDSWLVMRHGGGLGCYFCNDVVAPENSTKNRTLDQQCTVTRPGLAPIASSMAVELFVALLHHPLGNKAEAPQVRKKEFTLDTGGALGVMPHQIRGSLVSYTIMTPTVPAFSYCTGCAPAVVDAYHANKVELVQNVCESRDGSFLEDLSGLTAFRAEAADKMVDMEDWEEDE
jgi:ubiquitin-like modifier-activating enzyme ATG7